MDEERQRWLLGGVSPGTPLTPDDCTLYADWVAQIHDWLAGEIRQNPLDEDGDQVLDPIPVEQAAEWRERLREVALRLRSAGLPAGPPDGSGRAS